MGAHRTGTTTLQRSLQQNHHNLTKNGLIVWGPKTTRGGMFSGLLRGEDAEPDETARLTARNKGVIGIELDRLAGMGISAVLVSEENMLGGIRGNLRAARLYPGLSARLARFADVFGPVCTRVGLAIRPYQDFWASLLAHAIPQGHRMLCEDDLDRLVTQPRSWRDVISDVAKAFPKAEITLWDFNRMIGRPDAQVQILTGGRQTLPLGGGVQRHNASMGRAALRDILAARGGDSAAAIPPGDGRFMPFGTHHIEAMQGQYAADLAWLRTVAVGRLKFVDEVGAPHLDTQHMTKRGFG